jgi:outer membrane protein
MKNASRPFLFLSHIALLCTAIGAYGQNETLLDIYALAKANDHQLKSDYAEYLANSEAAAINRAALRPTIAGSANLSKTQTRINSANTETDETAYSISLSQPLINTNLWNTYKQGKTQTQIAEMTYEADKQSLMIRTAQAYFDTLREVDQLQTDIAEEKAQATLLEQTRQRYEVGLISINDVHETQAAYDNAVANRINTEANVGIQYDSLTVLTGKLHNTITPLKKDFAVVSPEPKDKQAWVDFALANNFELKASELTAEASVLTAKAAKSNHYPTLEGTITYNDRDRDGSTAGSLNDSNTTVFSLNLNVPIYAGGGVSARHRQAAQNAIAARENFLFTQRNTVQSTRSLYLSVTTDIAQIKARKQAIISNESALEATKAGYDAGTRDIVDVVDAQSSLFQAQRDYLDTLYDYIINTLLLKQAAGNLHVGDLENLAKSLSNH